MAVQAGGHQGSGKCTTCAMADVTVRMAGGRPIRAVLVHLGFLVLVGVVTQMHALGRLLVLTVRRSRSPEGLQRQKHEQENGEPATHWNQHCRGAVLSISCRMGTVEDLLEVGGYGHGRERADVAAASVAGWHPTDGGLRGRADDAHHLAGGLP